MTCFPSFLAAEIVHCSPISFVKIHFSFPCSLIPCLCEQQIRAICRMCNVDYDLVAAQRLIRRGAMSRAARSWASTGKSLGSSTVAVGSSVGAVASSSPSTGPGNLASTQSAQPQLTIKGVVAAINGWDAILSTNSSSTDNGVSSTGGSSGVRDNSPGPGKSNRNQNGEKMLALTVAEFGFKYMGFFVYCCPSSSTCCLTYLVDRSILHSGSTGLEFRSC